MVELTWVENRSSLALPERSRQRRAHHKSKAGCVACKRSHVKCDEKKPTCSRCLEHGWQCVSRENEGPQPEVQQQQQEQASQSIASSSQDVLLLDDDHISKRFRRSTLEQSLIVHFTTATQSNWLFTVQCQQVFQDTMLDTFEGAPFLRGAALATSASHLTHGKDDNESLQMTARMYYGQSLKSLIALLDNRYTEADVDATFSTVMLHALLAFYYSAADADETLDLTTRISQWLYAFRALTQIGSTLGVDDKEKQSAWFEAVSVSKLCVSDDEPEPDLEEEEHQGPDLFFCDMSGLRDLCESSTTLAERKAYKRALAALEPIMLGVAERSRIGEYFTFFSNVNSAFIDQVRLKRTPALLIVAFVLARLCDVDQWCVAGPAVVQCSSICRHLDTILPVESPAREQLRFPARACRYGG